MSTGVKTANEILSRIVEDLTARSIKGEDISSSLLRLRDELHNASENEDTVYAQFLRLLDSFREIIPEEHLRFQAAVAALSTTAKMAQHEIVQAIGDNLGKMKDNIAKLRQALSRLEKDEREISSAMTLRVKNAGAAVHDAGGVKKTVEQSVPVSPALHPHPVVQLDSPAAAPLDIFPDRVKINVETPKIVGPPPVQHSSVPPAPPAAAAPVDIFPDRIEKKMTDQKVEVPVPMPPPLLTEASRQTKKCAMCGGQMSLHAGDRMWMCLGCGYAEAGMIVIEDKQIIGGLIKSGQTSSTLSVPAVRESAWQHRCPMCGGQMNLHGSEKIWMCYSCAYEESQHSETPAVPKPANVRAEEPSFHAPVPATLPSEDEPIKGSIAEPARPKARHSSKKKPCPACRKKMTWHEADRAWRCPFCEYERRI